MKEGWGIGTSEGGWQLSEGVWMQKDKSWGGSDKKKEEKWRGGSVGEWK